MLHGYSQNHLTCRHVAPALAEDHTVVLADLRGYGDSGKPTPDVGGLVYSKRAMARDQVIDLNRPPGCSHPPGHPHA
jgi:haloacetate dehalogenase